MSEALAPQPSGIDRQAITAVLHDSAVELDDVEVALRRLDDGTYGTCEVCRTPIPDRVEADPVARRCAAHEVVATGEAAAHEAVAGEAAAGDC